MHYCLDGGVHCSDTAGFLYKTTDYWAPEFERCILWNDAELAIGWKLGEAKPASGQVAGYRKDATHIELLMVFLSWFLPFVLFPELHLPANVVEAGRLACLQVLPFMLATKVYFNVQPQGNKWVVGALAGAMALVALRGLV